MGQVDNNGLFDHTAEIAARRAAIKQSSDKLLESLAKEEEAASAILDEAEATFSDLSTVHPDEVPLSEEQERRRKEKIENARWKVLNATLVHDDVVERIKSAAPNYCPPGFLTRGDSECCSKGSTGIVLIIKDVKENDDQVNASVKYLQQSNAGWAIQLVLASSVEEGIQRALKSLKICECIRKLYIVGHNSIAPAEEGGKGLGDFGYGFRLKSTDTKMGIAELAANTPFQELFCQPWPDKTSSEAYLWGCKTWDSNLAQSVADAIKVKTWGFFTDICPNGEENRSGGCTGSSAPGSWATPK